MSRFQNAGWFAALAMVAAAALAAQFVLAEAPAPTPPSNQKPSPSEPPCQDCKCDGSTGGDSGEPGFGGDSGGSSPCASGSCGASGSFLPIGSGEVTLDSISVKISLGHPAFPGALPGGKLLLWSKDATPTLATPGGLAFGLDTRIVEVSTAKTANGEPRDVFLLNRDARRVWFRFNDAQSWAYPQDKFRGDNHRLLMVDAGGNEVVHAPTYYDLVYANGNRDRFWAAPDAHGVRLLYAVYTSGGRWNTLAGSGIEVLKDEAGQLRQIKVPQGMANIVTNTAFKYSIDIFAASAVGAKQGGYYTTNGSPLVSWVVENPDGTNSIDRLNVTRKAGGEERLYAYQYTAQTHGWSLTSGNGLVRESTYAFEDDTGENRDEFHETRGSDDVIVAKRSKLWHRFAWGESVVREVEDPDGAALLTTNTYYQSSAEPGRYARLMTTVRPDWGWVKYDYDANGRKALEITPWNDTPLSSGTNTARAVFYGYAGLEAGDSPGIHDQRPRTVTETVEGKVVARTYHVYKTVGGEEVHISERAAGPTSAYGAAGNLRTLTTYYGINDAASAGRTKSVAHPDGRLDSFAYTFGTYVTNAAPAQCKFTPGAGSAYRATVVHGTTNSPSGIAQRTTMETSVYDQYGRPVLGEQYVYMGGTNYARIGWTVRDFDEQGHVTRASHSNGQVEESVWNDCCGLASTTDGSGIRHEYRYDAIGRRIETVKLGESAVTNKVTYDAAGRVIEEERKAGGLSLTSTRQYDVAGRLTHSADEAGLVTSHDYVDGGHTAIVTMPGGATRITEDYLDGRVKSVTGTAGVAQSYLYGVNADSTPWTKVFTGPSGPNSAMWSKTVADPLGRTLREEKPGYGGTTLTNVFTYNGLGQLVKASAPGAADTVYQHDELGRQDRQGRVEGGVTNWLSGSESLYETVGSNVWQTQSSLVFPVDNDSAVTTSVRRVRLTGLTWNLTSETVSIDVRGNQTVASTAVDRANKTVTQTVNYPDSMNDAVNVSSNGVLRFTVSKSGVRTTYEYDALERQTVAETRSGSPEQSRRVASVTAYNGKGHVAYTEDAASNRTWLAYDPDTGRRIAVTNALGDAIYTQYDVQGRVTNTWGATYPVAYVFDDLGRMTEMHTWRQEGGSPDVTRWLYDEASGLLTNKVYADGLGPVYSYTAEGKLASRAWARGVVSAYGYDPGSGAMTNITYSDGTPAVSFTLDRLGRQVAVTDGTGSRTFTYNDFLQLAAETNVFGAITRAYDSLGRSSGFDMSDASYSVRYSYSDVGRFAAISAIAGGASNGWAYSYLPGSDLMEGWTPAGSGITFSRSFEAQRDLMTGVTNLAGALLVAGFDYQSDALGRRTQRIDAGSAVATNLFAYDARSQLTNATLNGSAFDWTFDPIGNRRTDTSNFVTHVYAANALNQYTTITNGGIRTLAYDLDGNLTDDGQFAYSWDGENRMTGASNGNAMLTFAHDYMGRRVSKKVYAYSGSWALSSDSSFVYDGWNLVREVSTSGGSAITNIYCWGTDLSGSFQGAGGIGGLLAVTRNGLPYYPCYDANGNITDYVDVSGTVVAHREYDAYGATVVSTGPLKDAFNFWFSSKYLDAETGLYYYGHRYYSPELGRWLSRDPMGEEGGENIYTFGLNQPSNLTDPLGLAVVPIVPLPPGIIPPGAGSAPVFSLGIIDPRPNEDRPCGQFSWAVEFKVTPAPTAGGIVIQKMNWTFWSEGPAGPSSRTSSFSYAGNNFTSPELYWEAFKIEYPSGTDTDSWEQGKIFDNTKGEFNLTGEADFYYDHGFPTSMSTSGRNHHWISGGAPSTTARPTRWWLWRNAPSSNRMLRTLKATWDCRCGRRNNTTVTTTISYVGGPPGA